MTCTYKRLDVVPVGVQARALRFLDEASRELGLSNKPAVDYAVPHDGAGEVVHRSEMPLAGWTTQGYNKRAPGLKAQPTVWLNLGDVRTDADLAKVVAHETFHCKQFYGGQWPQGRSDDPALESDARAYEKRFLERHLAPPPTTSPPPSRTTALSPSSASASYTERMAARLRCWRR